MQDFSATLFHEKEVSQRPPFTSASPPTYVKQALYGTSLASIYESATCPLAAATFLYPYTHLDDLDQSTETVRIFLKPLPDCQLCLVISSILMSSKIPHDILSLVP